MSFELLEKVKAVESLDDIEPVKELLGAEILRASSTQRLKNLRAIEKMVERVLVEKFLPAKDFALKQDQMVETLHTAIFEALGCFKGHVPAEVWSEAERILQEGFSKARLREGLK